MNLVATIVVLQLMPMGWRCNGEHLDYFFNIAMWVPAIRVVLLAGMFFQAVSQWIHASENGTIIYIYPVGKDLEKGALPQQILKICRRI